MGRQAKTEKLQQLEEVVAVDESIKKLEEVVIIGVASKHLKDGVEYKVNGETAYRLITKGVAKLK